MKTGIRIAIAWRCRLIKTGISEEWLTLSLLLEIVALLLEVKMTSVYVFSVPVSVGAVWSCMTVPVHHSGEAVLALLCTIPATFFFFTPGFCPFWELTAALNSVHVLGLFWMFKCNSQASYFGLCWDEMVSHTCFSLSHPQFPFRKFPSHIESERMENVYKIVHAS